MSDSELVIVKWDRTGDVNSVAVNELRYTGTIRRGSRVRMPWSDGVWRGKVLSTLTSSSEEGSSDGESDSDDIPLAVLKGDKKALPETSSRDVHSHSEGDLSDEDTDSDDIPLAVLKGDKKALPETERKTSTSVAKQRPTQAAPPTLSSTAAGEPATCTTREVVENQLYFNFEPQRLSYIDKILR